MWMNLKSITSYSWNYIRQKTEESEIADYTAHTQKLVVINKINKIAKLDRYIIFLSNKVSLSLSLSLSLSRSIDN